MNTLFKMILSAAIGAGLAWSYQTVTSSAEAPVTQTDLPGHFGSALGIEGPLTAKWRRIHSDEDMTFWVADDVEILAVSRSDQAVLLFSYIDEIQYFDIFEGGQPRITAEIAPDQRRMFVYSDVDEDEDKSWVYMDKNLDGIPEQRFNLGESGSAQQLQLTTTTAKIAD